MGFLFLFVGVLIGISAYRGTQADLWKLVVNDLTGAGSFIWWILAIGFIGGLGYIRPLRAVMEPLLVLIVLSLFLSNSGVFAKLNQEVKAGDLKPQPAPKDATSITGLDIGGGSNNQSGGNPLGGLTGGSDSGGGIMQYAQYAELAAMFA